MVADVYNKPLAETKEIFNSYGASVANILCTKNPSQILYGHCNQITLLDWGRSEEKHQVVYELADQDPDNVFRFLLKSDERLIVADMNAISTIDLRPNHCQSLHQTPDLAFSSSATTRHGEDGGGHWTPHKGYKVMFLIWVQGPRRS